jgi:hypothetical protein
MQTRRQSRFEVGADFGVSLLVNLTVQCLFYGALATAGRSLTFATLEAIMKKGQLLWVLACMVWMCFEGGIALAENNPNLRITLEEASVDEQTGELIDIDENENEFTYPFHIQGDGQIGIVTTDEARCGSKSLQFWTDDTEELGTIDRSELRVTKAENRIQYDEEDEDLNHKYIGFSFKIKSDAGNLGTFLTQLYTIPRLASDGPSSCRFSGARATLS